MSFSVSFLNADAKVERFFAITIISEAL